MIAPGTGPVRALDRPGPHAAVSPASAPFDHQASDFDLRAGLPAGVGRRVAAALAELAPANGLRRVILDLGAGTGQIGEHLARLCAEDGHARYLGIDLSGPMLAVFRRKLGAGGGSLVRADGSAPWPIASGRVELVFLSRAVHLLPPAVVIEETLRVARPEGAVVVFGGVRNDPESLRAVLRRQMRRLLAEHGVEGRNARAAQEGLAETLAARGAEVLPPVTAASWRVVQRAGDALANWRAKAGLGGRTMTPEVQERVLCRLEDRIRERYGSLDVAREATERYELVPIRLPGSSNGNRGTEKSGVRDDP